MTPSFSWLWRVNPVPNGYEWIVFKLYQGGHEDVILRGVEATKAAADQLALSNWRQQVTGNTYS